MESIRDCVGHSSGQVVADVNRSDNGKLLFLSDCESESAFLSLTAAEHLT